MNSIKATASIVKEVLEDVPRTRDSDNLLYAEVCRRINPEVVHWRFCEALENIKDLNIPGFETVRRTRQKLQAQFPELCGESHVEAWRTLRQAEFRAYAQEVT